ncbi:MAG: B12-binding domain-containing radical SAM protein, partial [Candidatus Methylomirabilis sp.]|nr:B12-binding domain-containing radical SAM protein [Deltaproteobacteria bacterium]
TEFSMRTAPIDYIVMGEGERIAVELFAGLDAKLNKGEEFDPASVQGLAWRRGEEIVKNERAARNDDPDELPWPAWDLFDLKAYDENNFVTGIKFGMTVPILATRGCPYSCTYCSSPRMWTTRWYARDPKDVADEIEHYKKTYGATNFPFQDLTAIVRKEWIVDFAKELIKRDLNVTWQLPSGTRCEVIDEEVAPLLFASGGRSMCFAPESGSERTRKLIKKKLKTESLMRAVEAAATNKLNISALLVIGFPHDEIEDVLQTAKLVRTLGRMGVEDIACAFFFPIPSTELYDYLIEKGRIALTDQFLMTPIFVHEKYLTEDRNYCEHISARTLTVLKYWIVANFYITAWVTHPGRVFRLLSNLITGKEESKMDTFLNETKRKLMKRFGLGKKTPTLPA